MVRREFSSSEISFRTDNAGKTRLILVDSPSYYHLPYEERVKELSSDISQAKVSSQVTVETPIQCQNEDHLKQLQESSKEVKNILLLSRPGSYYLQPSSTYQLGVWNSFRIVLIPLECGNNRSCSCGRKKWFRNYL